MIGLVPTGVHRRELSGDVERLKIAAQQERTSK
jgi:hypothetical protein